MGCFSLLHGEWGSGTWGMGHRDGRPQALCLCMAIPLPTIAGVPECLAALVSHAGRGARTKPYSPP